MHEYQLKSGIWWIKWCNNEEQKTVYKVFLFTWTYLQKFHCKYFNYISENDFWKIPPILNLPTDEEGESCENKKGGWKLPCIQCMRMEITLYTVYDCVNFLYTVYDCVNFLYTVYDCVDSTDCLPRQEVCWELGEYPSRQRHWYPPR